MRPQAPKRKDARRADTRRQPRRDWRGDYAYAGKVARVRGDTVIALEDRDPAGLPKLLPRYRRQAAVLLER